MNETILEMKGITKRFPGVLALDKAHIEVRKGEVHILVGENGAGKSTLMKILAGAYQSDSGVILLDNKEIRDLTPKKSQKLGISIIYQEFNLVPYLSVAENIFLGSEKLFSKIPGFVNWGKLYREAQIILDSLNVRINPKALVKNLGVAQQQMVEVAKALSINSNIIIMDEPSAALTTQEIDNLFRSIRDLRSKGVSIIYISHRLEEFKQIGDRVTVMRDGKTITTLDIHSASVDHLIHLMVGRELKDYYPKISVPAGEELLRVEKLNRKNVLSNISLTLHAGEILGISGLMGAGRTEIARAIFGLDEFDNGEVYIRGKKIKIKSPRQAIRMGIGFVTEDRKAQGLVLTSTVGENMTLASLSFLHKGFLLNLKQEKNSAKDLIKRLRIRVSSINQKAQNLSGGNQQKVVLAKWLLSESKIFLFDEPTRGIDVGAKVEVYEIMNALIKEGAGILLISSEMPEVIGLSDRILVMSRGSITGELKRSEATQEKILSLAALGANDLN